MPKKQNPQSPKLPPKKSLSSYIFSTLIIFALIAALYSAISGAGKPKAETVGLSEIARLSAAGEIKSIRVDGQDLTATKLDESVIKSKKEPDAALVETLASYGVPQAQLNAMDISVASEGGFW